MENIFKICGFYRYLKTRRIKKDGLKPSFFNSYSFKGYIKSTDFKNIFHN